MRFLTKENSVALCFLRNGQGRAIGYIMEGLRQLRSLVTMLQIPEPV